MSQIAEPLVSTLTESIIQAIKGQLKYVWSYKTYIKDLEDGLANLKNAKERREEEVDRANHNAEEIYGDVETWLTDADEIIEKAKEVMEKDENSKKGCFRGVILNPSTRFRIAKLAEGNKQRIDNLQQRNKFTTVAHQRVPVGIVTGSYKGPEYWIAPSRERLLERVGKAFLDARIVGIWGGSGVGKSTFLKQIEKQVQERKFNYHFDAVTIAIVSRSPNWEKVQDDLAYRLGLKMENENTVDQKAVRLRERLSQKDVFLVILDDIWEEVDLEKLGIPFDDHHPNIHLLLTSRSEQVLKSKMDSQHNFRLKPLQKSEAVDLFTQIVGESATNESTSIEQLAEQCAGLPVLISPLAASLKSLPSSAWADALTKLKQSRGLGIEKFVDKSLEFNYHLIESEEAKLLFLLCGRIGNQLISVDNLVIYGMGLGLLKGVRRTEEAREKVKLLLDNLKASCLLEDHNEGYVKLHDLMADAALSIASNAQTSLVIRNSKLLEACHDDDFKGCKSISIHLDDEMHELPERLICPELDMLLIGAKKRRNLEIPDAFFEDSRELKVLHMSKLNMTSLPPSMQFLSKLHTLYLDLGIAFAEDMKVVGKLKTLRVLTLRGYVGHIPKEFGELTNLRILNLTECWALRVIGPDVLGRLIHLEELSLPLGFDRWDAEGIDNASLTELNKMSYLSTLRICVPNVASLSNIIPSKQLVRYHIQVGQGSYITDGGKARTLKLEFDSRSSKLIWKEWVQTILRKTQDLQLEGWIGTQEIVTELSKEGFPELKHIYVGDCLPIKYIVHLKQPDPIPALESLSLRGLINLREICKGDLPHKFSNLKVIKIQDCNELRKLFSVSLVEDLPVLEEVEVSDCTLIQEIITYPEVERIDYGGRVGDKAEKLELKNLRTLILENLENISVFCSRESSEIIVEGGSSPFVFLDRRQVSLPNLESLTLYELPKLRKISHYQYPVNLHGLKSLQLLKCESLSYAVDFNFLQFLGNLESLEIEGCESMETVFYVEELNTCEAISNQSLKIDLKLSKLPRLKKIWNKYSHEISSVLQLKKLEVSNCVELENLFSSSMGKLIGNISHLSIDSCVIMKEIFLREDNSEEKIEFSSLFHLNISKMENLSTFSHGNHHYRFPHLTQLTISDCPKLRTFISAKHGKEELSCEDTAKDESFFNLEVDLPRLEKLVLHSLESMISIWDDNDLTNDSFYKLESIEIGNCPRIQSIFDPHLVERLQKLTKLKIESCGSLEVLFEDGHGKSKSRSGEEAPLGFPNLRDVFVIDCCKLTNLFPHASARSLSKLVDLCISKCERLVQVVSYDDEEDNMALTEELGFYNLSSMRLENLNSLVHFCSGNYQLFFPFLKKLSIIGCMKLKAFILRPGSFVGPQEQFQEISPTSNIEVDYSPLFDEKVVLLNLEELWIGGLEVKEIWPKKEPASFHMELKKLVVKDCHRLSTIVPSFMLHNLHGLEHLSVESCNSVEVIFELEKHSSRRQTIPRSKSTTKILEHLHELIVSSCESMRHVVATRHGDYSGETSYKTVILPQLSTLRLSKLPRLGNFCQENHEVELPSLVELEMSDCQATEVLVADSDQDCRPLLLVEKVEFPRMESMEISDMRKLTELWHIGKEGTQIECSSDSFCKLKQLKVRGCENLLTVFPSKMLRAFHNLEELSIKDCESLESVFESPSSRSEIESNNFDDVVPTAVALRELQLKVLPRMKHVGDIEDPKWANLSFEKVEDFSVEGCHSLKHLFPASVASCLKELWSLRIADCEGMEEIVWNEESANHQEFISTPSPESTNLSLGMHSLEWPSLHTLGLVKCPNAKIFAPVQQKVNIPRLVEIRLDGSTRENRQFLEEISANPKSLFFYNIKNQAWVEIIPWSLLLERFPDLRTLHICYSDSKEIFPSDNEKEGVMVSYLSRFLNIFVYECHHLTILVTSSAPFHNITELSVDDCNGLRYLVTSSVARGLVQLKMLSVSNCKNIEEIVTYDCDENGNRANDEADIISFPYLKDLGLFWLPKLQSFSSTSCKFNFPSLRDLRMIDVPKMHVFCEGDFTCPCKGSITRRARKSTL